MTRPMVSTAHATVVRDQYEGYPYPFRRPEDERHRLIETIGASLDQVNYHCFEGKQAFGPNFRALDAGGGTGDNTIFLAEQLRVVGGEVVYVDFSDASMQIAKQRAAMRGLSNITFVHDSLLNVPNLGLGPFDLIVSTGVLHHLPDPDAGIAALAKSLKPGGAMLMMLYAAYGRAAIYPLQEALRHLAPHGSMPDAERVAIARKLLDNLSPLHWFNHGTWYKREIEEYGDVAIYDMLLHAQDRAYTIPQVYEFVEKPGLTLLGFLNVAGHVRPMLRPELHLRDPELVARLQALPVRDRQAAMELIVGSLSRHVFYAATTPRTPPGPDRLDYIPYITEFVYPPGIYHALAENAKTHAGTGIRINHDASGVQIELRPSPHMAGIFAEMDGERSLKEIFSRIRAADPAATEAQLMQEFASIFDAMSLPEWMFLRAPGAKRVRFVDIRAKAL